MPNALVAVAPKAPPVGAPGYSQSITALESCLAQLPQVALGLRHFMAPGVYVREQTCAEGVAATTLVHKTEHLFILAAGAAHVWTEETGPLFVRAPFIGRTKPGCRRAIVVVEPVVWFTIHANPEDGTDLETLEDTLFYKHDPRHGEGGA